MDSFGTAISMSLQYGVPLEVLVNKFSHTRFEPMGHTTNPDIRIAKSMVDYIFRWLGITFLPGYREAASGSTNAAAGTSPAAISAAPPKKDPQADGNGAPESSETATSARYNGPSAVGIDASSLERAGVAVAGTPDSRNGQFAGFQSDAPSCDNCGSITVRNGNCYLCHNCGASMGCS